MNYLREFLYRPKRTDKSPMARFYFADEALTAVAAELDSFDGRKDPDRCSCLVNKLRSCQDKLLTICSEMLEQLEPGHSKRSREFRAKFPDDIMTDNLAGQLWFGAECLAAGSSIMHKESESEQMRPLAKAVTKSLETVRRLLREQCLSALPDYTEKIREHLKIFDRMFADFEYNYVCCMVHVKSVKEYELHQDLIVLFSDTLLRALKQEMVSQDMVDECDPSLMFAIPRLAIVYGLLICPKGPLNVDRSGSDFPDLFLPFKNLLRKIRELLQTLNASEVMVLEMLLCQQEEPANISTKLKEVERMLENKEETEEEKAQALKLCAKLESPVAAPEMAPPSEEPPKFSSSSSSSVTIRRLNSIPCACDASPMPEQSCDNEATQIAEAIVQEVLNSLFESTQIQDSPKSDESYASSKPKRPADIEIDCTRPEIEIRVSPRHRRSVTTSTREEKSDPEQRQQQQQPHHHHHHRHHHHRSQDSQKSSSSSVNNSSTSSSQQRRASSMTALTPSVSSPSLSSSLPQSESVTVRVTSSNGGVLKRRNARRDTKRVPYKYQKDRRAKFKSTEDLLHRLYVCISGAADQLQSNYAGDFRSILRAVFIMNATQDEPDTLENGSSDENQDSNEQTPAAVAADLPLPAEQVIPPVDLATDALHHELGRELYDQHLRQRGRKYEEFSDDDEHEEETLTPQSSSPMTSHEPHGAVYGQNLGLHVSEDQLVHEFSLQPSSNEFYQPEPALLDIASGGREEIPEISPVHSVPDDVYDDAVVGRPPAWVPDALAPNCFGCAFPFTVLRRRHHCRACGGVFCGRCSSHSIPLPNFGLPHPVRVCNRCHLLMDQVQSPISNPASPAQSSSWNRSFGMVS